MHKKLRNTKKRRCFFSNRVQITRRDTKPPSLNHDLSHVSSWIRVRSELYRLPSLSFLPCHLSYFVSIHLTQQIHSMPFSFPFCRTGFSMLKNNFFFNIQFNFFLGSINLSPAVIYICVESNSFFIVKKIYF